MHTANNTSVILNLEVETVLMKAPCILHVTNIDMIFNDPAQQQSSLPEDSLDELFCVALTSFLKDLNEGIDSNFLNGAATSADGNLKAIVVAVDTKYANKLKPTLRSLFGSEIKLTSDRSNDADILSSVRNALSVCCGDNKIELSKEAEKALVVHIEAHNMSERKINQFVNEVKLTALARQRFSLWMDTISPSCSATLSSRTNQFPGPPQDRVTITTGDVQRTVREIPHLSGFDTVNGFKDDKSQHKQAKIAPVYWADIGGLDR